MTHEITPDNHYTAGESVTWEYTIEQDGSVKDLSGFTVEWYLVPAQGADNSEAKLSTDDSGVSATVVDAANGRVDLTINRGVTDDLAGNLWQRLVLDDSGSGRQIWAGPFPVHEP